MCSISRTNKIRTIDAEYLCEFAIFIGDIRAVSFQRCVVLCGGLLNFCAVFVGAGGEFVIFMLSVQLLPSAGGISDDGTI